MKGLRKVGKVLNTDVGKLARGVKRGMAKRKVKKIRQDRYAAKAARGLRDKAGFGKYREKAINKNPKNKKEVRKNWKAWAKGEKAYNQRGGVTKGMQKAEKRQLNRRLDRQNRKIKIAKRKKRQSDKINKIAAKNRDKVAAATYKYQAKAAGDRARAKAKRPQANKSQIATAKRNRNVAQGKKDYRKGMTTAQYAASLKDK